MSPSTEPLPRLGERYTALRLVGAGGMGRVYLAHDARHDRQVAVKVLDPDYARNLGVERFLREIRIAARLNHPGIVPLYDSGQVDGDLFYVMPYVEGETLRARLDREKMLPLEDALRWAAEVCEALSHAHAQGIIHRDIKPENLLIHAGHVLITDFGIGRAIDLAAQDSLTSEQFVVGTPAYMSPEQATGAPVDGRTDVYSLACVVYEMLTGEPPHGGVTPRALIAKKLAGPYIDPRVIRPAVPRSLERTLAKALAVIPADRFESAAAFARGLTAAAQPQRRRVRPWIGALALAGAGAGLAILLAGRPGATPAAPSRPRVVVGAFENRTGDPRHDALGFMAGDWITEGLQQTAAVEVVPTVTALAAARFVGESAGSGDPLRQLARETGATLVISGAIYQDKDTLILQAQLADAAAGRLVGAVEPVRALESQQAVALQQLRARLMGLLALTMDDRTIPAERPPTYPAYQAFSEGIRAYTLNDYPAALPRFERAYALDTTFVLALLYAAFCHTNEFRYGPADSVLRMASRQRDRLNEHDRYWLDYQMAELAGDRPAAVAAIRRAAELAPTSKAVYNFAVAAFEARQPFPAESALRRLSPDVGSMRDWLPYWDQLASALHVEGKHREELAVAREARRRFPARLDAYLPEARALAAERRTGQLEELWSSAAANAGAGPSGLATLAYETGMELRAHGERNQWRTWLQRADGQFRQAELTVDSIDARWGRMRASAALGKNDEAIELGEALVAADSTRRDFYLGLLGIALAREGRQAQAAEIMERLAADRRPYTFAEPQFQAARIAAELGRPSRGTELLTVALGKGYPYDLEYHRDESLPRLGDQLVLRQLGIHTR